MLPLSLIKVEAKSHQKTDGLRHYIVSLSVLLRVPALSCIISLLTYLHKQAPEKLFASMPVRPPSVQERLSLAASLPPTRTVRMTEGNTVLFSRRKGHPLDVYRLAFREYLPYRLRRWTPLEVSENLESCFPDCDLVDCEYLEDVMTELRLKGVWSSDNIEYGGSGKRFTVNAAKVDFWIKKQRSVLGKEEAKKQNPIEVILPFYGTVSSVAELLYKLEREGIIRMQPIRNQRGGLSALARTLVRVFPPAGSKSKDPARALEIALRKIPLEQLGVGKVDENVLSGMGKKKSTFQNKP